MPRFTAYICFFCALSAGWTKAASEEIPYESLFALVIGVNSASGPNSAKLRYADDDAVQTANLMEQLGATVYLLVDPDIETKRLHPGVSFEIPRQKAVFAALKNLNKKMAEAKASGSRPVFYFFYSGHGDVEHNEGFVKLADGKLRRHDLVKLLNESNADVNHVIIDACKSYFMVFERGPGGARKPIEGNINLNDGEIPRNSGIFLSTSSSSDSHEWEAYQSGIFSHEIRSALRGAADIDLNGEISYDEAAAFIWNANRGIANDRFRPRFFSRPPAPREGVEPALARLDSANGDRLYLGPGAGHHSYVEDKDGLRIADFHPTDQQKLVLIIPTARPLFVRSPGMNTEYELPVGPSVHLANLSVSLSKVGIRGAEHEAFASLFSEAFDETAIEMYMNAPRISLSGEDDSRKTVWLRRSIGLGSALFAISGGIMTVLASSEKKSVTDTTTGIERQEINENIRAFNTAAVTCYIIAGSMLVGYLTWTLLPRKKVDITLTAGLETKLGFSVEF